MFKILSYCFFDLIRGRWIFIYFSFYFLLGFGLLFLNRDISNAVITLMNIVIYLVPLIATVFGVTYYYASKEFTELLLAQPIKRRSIIAGQYLGVALSLSLSLILGLGIPFIISGVFQSPDMLDFFLLLVIGCFLTLIFTAISFNISIANTNRLKGFGYSVLTWLFLSVIYDGIFLIILIALGQYPLDKLSLFLLMLNPIDLSRTLMLLNLDISALLGYTGAIYKMFFGTFFGIISSSLTLIIWTILPIVSMVVKVNKKDF